MLIWWWHNIITYESNGQNIFLLFKFILQFIDIKFQESIGFLTPHDNNKKLKIIWKKNYPIFL